MKHSPRCPCRSAKRPSAARLDAIVCAHSPRTARRYASAEEMDADLARVAKGVAIDDGRTTPRRRCSRRRPDGRCATTVLRARPGCAPRRRRAADAGGPAFLLRLRRAPARLHLALAVLVGLVIATGIAFWMIYHKVASNARSRFRASRATCVALRRQDPSRGLVPNDVSSTTPRAQASSSARPAPGNHEQRGDRSRSCLERRAAGGGADARRVDEASGGPARAENLKPKPHEVPSTKTRDGGRAGSEPAPSCSREGLRINISKGQDKIVVPGDRKPMPTRSPTCAGRSRSSASMSLTGRTTSARPGPVPNSLAARLDGDLKVAKARRQKLCRTSDRDQATATGRSRERRFTVKAVQKPRATRRGRVVIAQAGPDAQAKPAEGDDHCRAVHDTTATNDGPQHR